MYKFMEVEKETHIHREKARTQGACWRAVMISSEPLKLTWGRHLICSSGLQDEEHSKHLNLQIPIVLLHHVVFTEINIGFYLYE